MVSKFLTRLIVCESFIVVPTTATMKGSAMKAHTPISAEARGKLRALKTTLAAQYARIHRIYGSDVVQSDVAHFAMKSGKGRERARAKIIRALGSGAHLEQASNRRMTFVAFNPRDSLIQNSDDPSINQDCVSANYVIAGDSGSHQVIGFTDGFWTIEFKDHALGRLLMRDRDCDPV